MNVAEWILVAILSITLFVFLVVGIVLMTRMFGLIDETKRVVRKSQDIADNANGVVSNVRGLTSVGGTVEMLVDKYINPKLKENIKERKENDRAKREETLERLANKVAEKVVRNGRNMTLEPMNPFERRIIHSTLQGNENVTTYSIGEEPNRKVVVALEKNR